MRKLTALYILLFDYNKLFHIVMESDKSKNIFNTRLKYKYHSSMIERFRNFAKLYKYLRECD